MRLGSKHVHARSCAPTVYDQDKVGLVVASGGEEGQPS